jgi:hypothetical protein
LYRISEGTKIKTQWEVCFSKREAMIRLSGATEVVIKHWPTAMQDKMRRKNSTLNNLLLEHLFNLSCRGDTFLVSEVMVDYNTHWMLIQICLHNAIGYSHCRYQDAKEAYQYVTRHPMGSELNSVDLQLLTGGFGDYLSQQLEGRGHLDTLLTSQVEDACTGIKSNLKVRTYDFKSDETSQRPGFRAWVIDNPISCAFQKRLETAMLNRLPFMAGVRGKSTAYVRNASPCASKPAPIVIADRTVYASQPASAI